MTEEKEGEEYLDPKTNPMIRIDVPDERNGFEAGDEPAPFGDTGPEDDEVASAVKVFLGGIDGSIELLAAPGLPLSRSFDGMIELNGKPLDAASIAERRALTDAAQAKQKDAAEAMSAEDVLDPSKNSMIKLD